MISAILSAFAVTLLVATGLYLWYAAYRALLFHVAAAIVLPPFLCVQFCESAGWRQGAESAGVGWVVGFAEVGVVCAAVVFSAAVFTAMGWMVFGCHPWLLYRSGRRAWWISPHTPETAMLLSLGLYTTLAGLTVLWHSSRYQVLGFRMLTTSGEVAALGVRASDVVAVVLAVTAFAVATLLYGRTEVGLRIRMIADRPALAGSLGERGIGANIATVFGGALLFGTAGVISAVEHGFTVTSGFRHLLVGAAALVISGAPPGGRLWPRLPISCLAATMLAAAAAWYLGPVWADALAFLVLAGALALQSMANRDPGLKKRR